MSSHDQQLGVKYIACVVQLCNDAEGIHDQGQLGMMIDVVLHHKDIGEIPVVAAVQSANDIEATLVTCCVVDKPDVVVDNDWEDYESVHDKMVDDSRDNN